MSSCQLRCRVAVCHSCKALLRGSKSTLGVIPWLDHGIQKNT
ncbi:hypothetical protein [Rickettsia sp.]